MILDMLSKLPFSTVFIVKVFSQLISWSFLIAEGASYAQGTRESENSYPQFQLAY